MSIHSVTEDNLYDATRKVLDTLGFTSVSVVFSNENALEPSKTYCVINILDIQQRGYRDEGTYLTPNPDDADSPFLEFIVHYTVLTQFSFIGLSAGDAGMDFRHNLVNNRKCVDIYRAYNFGMLEKSSLRRAPQMRETNWVDGYNMDINLSFAVNTKQVTDWVDTIAVNDRTLQTNP